MMTTSNETPPAQTHELKTWPQYFAAVAAGAKTFEIRKNDRGFRVGDRLVLREFDPERQRFTGREVGRDVSYVTEFAQQPGYVVMGLAESRVATPAPTGGGECSYCQGCGTFDCDEGDGGDCPRCEGSGIAQRAGVTALLREAKSFVDIAVAGERQSQAFIDIGYALSTRLAAALAAASAGKDGGWIACSDRMPREGERVLIGRPHERVEIGRWGSPPTGYGYPADHPPLWWAGGEALGVTCWQPLPPIVE